MSFNAITNAAKAAAGLIATATTGGDDDGATPITQDYIKVNEFDDQDAEPQPGEEEEKPAAKEDPTADNSGAQPPPKKPRRDEGLPADVPEGAVAASIARKVGRDLFTALNKDLDRQGRTENKTVLAKFLLELATELGNTGGRGDRRGWGPPPDRQPLRQPPDRKTADNLRAKEAEWQDNMRRTGGSNRQQTNELLLRGEGKSTDITLNSNNHDNATATQPNTTVGEQCDSARSEETTERHASTQQTPRDEVDAAASHTSTQRTHMDEVDAAAGHTSTQEIPRDEVEAAAGHTSTQRIPLDEVDAAAGHTSTQRIPMDEVDTAAGHTSTQRTPMNEVDTAAGHTFSHIGAQTNKPIPQPTQGASPSIKTNAF